MKTTLLLSFLLASIACAFPAKLRWNKNPAAENVSEYRVYRIIDGLRVLQATVPAVTDEAAQQFHPMDVSGGEVLVVTAYNGFESDGSDPFTVPTKPSKPGAVEVVEIQVSANLTDWETLAFVPLKTSSASRFVRTRIASLTP